MKNITIETNDLSKRKLREMLNETYGKNYSLNFHRGKTYIYVKKGVTDNELEKLLNVFSLDLIKKNNARAVLRCKF